MICCLVFVCAKFAHNGQALLAFLDVTNDLSITTEEGNIAIGKVINSAEGTVTLQAQTGSILVGKDITAGNDVKISSKEGNIVVGDKESGDDGDILSKNGDVTIRTDKGSIEVVKTVTAEKGSVDISSGKGEYLSKVLRPASTWPTGIC